jgi:hypothetical protein
VKYIKISKNKFLLIKIVEIKIIVEVVFIIIPYIDDFLKFSFATKNES